MLKAAGHVGAWAGLYGVAAFLCVVQLAGAWQESSPGRVALTAAAVWLITTGAYALDRVKLRTAWIDPADVLAQPARYDFLTRHTRAVRALAFALIAAGAAVGFVLTPWAPLAAAAAATGILAYALKPRAARPRLKDRLWAKNAYVAAGITGFAGLASLAAVPRSTTHAAALCAACALVLVRVWLDAALCDIDDEATDRAHRTATLPTTIGTPHTWTLTGAARVALIGAMLACVWCPLRARVAWAAAAVIGLALLRLRRPAQLRDPVDLRFIAEAALASCAVCL